MDVAGKVIAITGGASGIGKALALRFKAEGAAGVAVCDLDGAGAAALAAELGGYGAKADVSREAEIAAFVEETEKRLGPIDLFCSNAGVATPDPDRAFVASAPDALWTRDWEINVMAHVYAARALVPRMKARGGGYFLNTVSAAGLLSQIGSAIYSTTKHAAIGFAEALAITHRDDRIRVSVLCPQAVDTPLFQRSTAAKGGLSSASVDGVMTPETVADAVMEGLRCESFLILPHPQVLHYMQNKAGNYDRWIGGMAKFRRSLAAK